MLQREQKQAHRREFMRLAGALQRIEWADLSCVRALARSNTGLVMPVSIRPGHTALIRTPAPESEYAVVCTRLMTPACSRRRDGRSRPTSIRRRRP